MHNIAIIGCGYVGSEAARIWTKREEHVTVTTRNPEKLDSLSKLAQKSTILKGNDENELVPLIANNEIFLISIGADGPDAYEAAYLQTAETFRHLALSMNTPRHLIYTSSGSVYGDHGGQWVDETSDLLAKTAQAKILIETEKTYLSLTELGWSVSILRFGEIYGPKRSLSDKVKEWKGRSLPGSGNFYTNMVHRDDCAAAIDYILQHDLDGIYNLADDDHPTRRELYDRIAKKFNYPTILWDPNLTGFYSGNKRLSNHKIKSKGFSLRHPTRLLD